MDCGREGNVIRVGIKGVLVVCLYDFFVMFFEYVLV